MSTPHAPGGGRRPRADAERNRALVLAAARALFEERGEEVQMPEVARAAGVGIGTLYRHFPSKQALVEAAAEQRFAGILELALTDCLREPAAGRGLERYLHHVGGALARSPGLTAAALSAAGSSAPAGATLGRLEEAVAALIAQGRAAGTLREDLGVPDVYMIVGGLSAIIRTGSGDWRRFLSLTLDGLRPRGAGEAGPG
ncbi:helix-turn-helix domain-containing protein [Streptomyces sp. NPDC089915]|uniref:TetR/AcrR family transcriptional regulator n=1 Tax=Streptomyces sp. NPDC089915 TaxID=3155186 RepID=UPI003445716F